MKTDDLSTAAQVGLALVLLFAVAPLRAWALMVLLGVVHAEVLPAVLPVGYWVCLAMSVLIGLARVDS